MYVGCHHNLRRVVFFCAIVLLSTQAGRTGDRQSGNLRSKAFVCWCGLSSVRGFIHAYIPGTFQSYVCLRATYVRTLHLFFPSFYRSLYLPIVNCLLLGSRVGWAIYWSQADGLASGWSYDDLLVGLCISCSVLFFFERPAQQAFFILRTPP